jgi:DNA-binding transcriptional LysR family regulator
VLEEFTTTYPAVELRILATNDILDLTRLEADLAIRISAKPGDSLTGLRLLQQETASFANEQIAERIKADPTAMIDWVVYDAYSDVPKGIDKRYPNNRVKFRFDDMVAMIGAAQAGLGVVRAPMFLGRQTSGMVQVPILKPQTYTDVWVVGHPDVWPSKKLAAFREILIRHCKAKQSLFMS